MLRGLYIPGEHFHPGTWDADLARFQSLGVNILWVTHKTAKDTAEIARRADRHGIQIVAALATLDGSVEWHRNRSLDQIVQLVDEIIDDWGDAPWPVAFCLCDEPKPPYLDDLNAYIEMFRATMKWPVAVLPHVTNVEAVATIGCEWLGCFSYSYVKGAA